jgi:hypothetical protein
MSIHRGIVATATLVALLATGACDGGGSDEPTDPTPSPSSTSASPTAAEASADPRIAAIPVDGNDDVEVTWSLDDGVDAKDPIVDVGRRTLALVYLSTFSPQWRSDAAIEKVSDALGADDDAVLEATRGTREAPDPKAAKGPVTIVVQPPQVSGDTAVLWMCLDAGPAYDGGRASTSNSGRLASVTLTVVDGTWKAASYSLNPKDPTKDERYYQRCQQNR